MKANILALDDAMATRIKAHSAETYPHECCGALLGTDSPAAREVRDIFPLVNRRDDSPNNRFSISAADFVAAERQAFESGLELIGWYHSHPDHPARPSEFDREHAWPWYSYVIVSIRAGQAGELASWRLTDDRARFEPEEITLPQTAASPQATHSS